MPTYASPPPPLPPTPPHAAPTPASAPSGGPASWAAQILARQRVLDNEAPARAPVPPSAPLDSAPNLGGFERTRQAVADTNALGALEHGLVEVRDTMQREMRALAERLDRTRHPGADAFSALQHGLAEVRDALRSLTPTEGLGGFEDALRALSHKIDQIAVVGHSGGSETLAISQLEHAIVSLRSIVPNVASDQALARLSADVQALAGQVKRAAADSSADALDRLEARFTAIMDGGPSIPLELEAAIRELNERLDRMQISQGDQLALGALEDRIANLSEKLDTSHARLRQFDAIERGLGDLLLYLEEMRRDGRGLRATTPPAAPERESARAPTHAAQLPRSPLDLLNDLLPPAEVAPPPRSPLDLLNDPPQPMRVAEAASQPMPSPAPSPEPAAAQRLVPPDPPAPPPSAPMPAIIAAPKPAASPPPPPKAMVRNPQRAPLEPYLPPDTPLEPGSGTPRLKPGSAAARIAASEAALGQARPMAHEPGSRSALIAAARSAAKAASLDTPVKVPEGFGARAGGLFKWPFKKKAEAPSQRPPQDSQKLLPEVATAPSIQPTISTVAMSHDPALDRPLPRSARAFRFVKTVLIAASVAIIVVGAAQTAWELLFPEEPTKPPISEQPLEKPQVSRPLAVPSWPTPPQGESQPPTPPAEPTAPAANDRASFFDPSTMMTPKPQASEVTGSVSRQPTPTRTPAAPTVPAAEAPTAGSMPSGISAALRTAAAASNAAAEYEIGARYAEGRGVPQSSQEAVRWFEKAANAGFVPAQFRLASLNEKGDGVKKDVQAARRLYLAAAGKGHAKAMHNLAVLYAEGVDGKPDYKAAGQWFRKAAGYGITDSQYNLAILYARGIGVEPNLAESYKWFALAAGNGDTEAAKKRDDVGSQLDKNTLTAAKLAIQTFVPDREPDEATNLRVPPGGWDRAQAAAPVTPRRRTPASSAQ